MEGVELALEGKNAGKTGQPRALIFCHLFLQRYINGGNEGPVPGHSLHRGGTRLPLYRAEYAQVRTEELIEGGNSPGSKVCRWYPRLRFCPLHGHGCANQPTPARSSNTSTPLLQSSSSSPSFSHATRGWQSPRFCNYPQEIGFELGVSISSDPSTTPVSSARPPVRMRQVQILSHQCKIATKIEVFTALATSQSTTYQNAVFQRLGYLSLDSNARSQFQAREVRGHSPLLREESVFLMAELGLLGGASRRPSHAPAFSALRLPARSRLASPLTPCPPPFPPPP